MPGANNGTGQPLTLKCSQCKKRPSGSGSGRVGALRRTGAMRERHIRGRAGHVRIGNVSYKCVCLICGHIGWYAHKDAAKLALAEPAT
jgi:hypothetical protein